MRILIVAMSDSVHAARWVSLMSGQGWDIHLFPSTDLGTSHQMYKNVTVHHSVYGRRNPSTDQSVKLKGIPVFSDFLATAIRYVARHVVPAYRQWQLAWLIQRLKPDIIHTMEIQSAGYRVSALRKNWTGQFPRWILTNWGSDIYYFSNFDDHKEKIVEALSLCDYFSCECRRDVHLAHTFGFDKQVLPVMPVSGGFDLSAMRRLRQKGPTSARRVILIKGYHNWAGRALVAIEALALCAQYIHHYQIVIYSADDVVRQRANALLKPLHIDVTFIPLRSDHQTILRYFGKARVAIGLSISDGISTLVLEAMVMGAFPIQSNTSCAGEWIKDGQTGIIVPPEDVRAVARALQKALTDDAMVDSGAKHNDQVAEKELDISVMKPKVISFYEHVYQEHKK